MIALLDITKCLYDAISRMEKAAEQGSAIAAAVEGVERQWGNNFSGLLRTLYLLRTFKFFMAMLGSWCMFLFYWNLESCFQQAYFTEIYYHDSFFIKTE